MMPPINIAAANQKIGLTKLYLKTESEYFRKKGRKAVPVSFKRGV
jgi:hypothetical protein